MDISPGDPFTYMVMMRFLSLVSKRHKWSLRKVEACLTFNNEKAIKLLWSSVVESN